MSDTLPRVFDSGQLSLFPTAPRELCKRLGLSWWTAVQLHNEGFISFNPEDVEHLDEPEMAELSFVGSMVVANCPPAVLRDLFSSLTKPYCYSHNSIYYHWPSRTWKQIPKPTEDPHDYHPSLKWELIPKFPVYPEAWDLFNKLSRKSEEYSAAFQWFDSLYEANEMDTLRDMNNFIEQLLSAAPAERYD